ncbi:MAG: hypothetical protein OXH59_05630 [Rhodospirillaceae bacterium]|nr:hypothetical protein [Rhodospirillaceae bacterium]
MDLSDAYFDTREEAFQEAHRRKTSLGEENVITFYERTAYGNWRVYSVFADVMVDALADGPVPSPHVGLHRRNIAWAK